MIDAGMSPYMHGYEAHTWTAELARHHTNKKFKADCTYGVLRKLPPGPRSP